MHSTSIAQHSLEQVLASEQFREGKQGKLTLRVDAMLWRVPASPPDAPPDGLPLLLLLLLSLRCSCSAIAPLKFPLIFVVVHANWEQVLSGHMMAPYLLLRGHVLNALSRGEATRQCAKLHIPYK